MKALFTTVPFMCPAIKKKNTRLSKRQKTQIDETKQASEPDIGITRLGL